MSTKILHKHCFYFLLGLTIFTRELETMLINAKFWVDKQRILRYFWYWLMGCHVKRDMSRNACKCKKCKKCQILKASSKTFCIFCICMHFWTYLLLCLLEGGNQVNDMFQGPVVRSLDKHYPPDNFLFTG